MSNKSQGMTLVETLVALAVLGIGILMAGSVVFWAERVEQRAMQRVAALDLAAGVAEQVRASSYHQVRSGSIVLDEEVLPASLPEPSVELDVEEYPDRGVKFVTIQVTWEGRQAGELSLTTAVGDAELYR